ncbi:MAG: CPBP family intramembrane metalloprotease [Candidatus Bathyarchaeota archaeon]|nr:CPBP family intramembrane metalloprotease [Candidatus Bathyarchaeota archaeon]
MGNRETATMKATRELQLFLFYLSFIVAAEVVTSFVDPSYGLFLHSTILVSLLTLAAVWYGKKPASGMLQSLSLAPLIRILSLSLPLSYFPQYTWYVVAGIPVLGAAIIMMRIQGLTMKDVGLTLRKPVTQVCIASTGIVFGAVEYFILKPKPLALGLSMAGYTLLSLALIISTGFVEELVFRGVLQKNAVNILGQKTGIVGVTAVFAALHIGWLNILDVVFVFLIGLFFAIAALKTGSIVGATIAHGITNVFLFIVMFLLPINL